MGSLPKAAGHRRRLRLVVLAVSLLISESAWSGPTDGTPSPNDAEPDEFVAPRVRLREYSSASAVRRAITGARRRVAQPGCQQLLVEFTDASGRTLREALADLGRTPQEHLDRILFYDGTSRTQCGRPGVAAVTSPGNVVVLICSPLFTKLARADRVAVEYIVIHEMLHTLGLGEHPPSPRQIDARVASACRSQ